MNASKHEIVRAILAALITASSAACAAPIDPTTAGPAEGDAADAPLDVAVADGLSEAPRAPLSAAVMDGEVVPLGGPTLSLAFLPPGSETLPARRAPSEQSPVVAELDGFTLDIPSTGAIRRVDDTEWVEVYARGAGLAWIPRGYTSEWIPSEDFCDADLADALLGELAAAILESNEDRVAALLSPVHGLRVRYLLDAEVYFEGTSAAVNMDAVQPLDWGFDDVSGTAIIGSFDGVVGRELAAVIASGETSCNRLALGAAAADSALPAGQENINFYSVHVPDLDEAGRGWVTWMVGVTFVDGEAYIASLNRYGAEG